MKMNIKNIIKALSVFHPNRRGGGFHDVIPNTSQRNFGDLVLEFIIQLNVTVDEFRWKSATDAECHGS